MIAYIIRRLIQAVFVLIIVSLLIFLVMRLLPGDPIMLYLAEHGLESLTPEQIATAREEFGLDKPLMTQYIDWTSGLFRGDFGISIFYHEQVGKLLAERIPVTLHLGLLAFVISGILGILAGLVVALRRGGLLDTVVTSLANLGITVPVFWLGILMIYAFGLQLRWLPICGYTSPFEDFWLSTRQALMPVLCLSVFSLAATARQTRSSILEVVRQDYIRTAWAKGLRERVIVMRHVLKNGLIPVVTLLGVHMSHILGGAVLIETVFNIPGMGRLMVQAIFAHDYQIVQGGILLSAIVVVLANLIVDISYGWLDPRVRYG
jgi:peptide/nickel transport system permease protein